MAVIMPLLQKQTVFAGKIETTTGTAIALAAADGTVNIMDSDIKQDSEQNKREGQSSLTRLKGVRGAQAADIEFVADVVGGASLPPPVGKYLQASGFAVSSSTYTVQTGSASAVTLTCGKYTDGRLKQAAGCMFDLVIKLKSGEPGRMEFKGKGAWVAPTDVALIAPTYDVTLPPAFAAATFTVGGTAYPVDEVEISLGNKVVLRQDPSQASGYIAAVITDREVTVKIAPEAKLLASQDWYAAYAAGTTYALNCVIGASANNIITITAPALQLMKAPEDDDRDGVLVESLEFISVRSASAGDDELVVAFT